MTGVKRLAAGLLFLALVAGAWLLLRPPPAAHLLLSGARIEDGPGGPVVTLQIGNSGGPDRLVSAEGAGQAARIVSIEGTTALPIPAGTSPQLSEDGAYILLEGQGPFAPGQLVPLTLTFEGAGPVTTQARVAGPAPTPAKAGSQAESVGDIAAPMASGGMSDHAGHAMPGKAHDTLAPVPGDRPAPDLALTATPDGDGWVLRVETENFTFNEDLADGPHVPGVGHAHLYLDGLKLQRLYQRDARIGALLPGRYTVRVTLNTNDHRIYAKDGKPISVTAIIEAQ
ncbi:copper chaperone PCu(A)C [Marinibacterium profundimaris]|uniref:copper chaperone PCu(A)C n=1 Tax=Marinibacterium profundimaris TaxID=1679460 RepID=UPI000B521C65|nr:copper chaperone PCu(A)C [Marinibacterium profundimaris]